jgi:COP9 signalosome complex subunit 4
LTVESFEAVGTYILSLIKQSSSPYDEGDYLIREGLFEYYINKEDFTEAAQTLCVVNLDSSVYPFAETQKADILIKCSGNLHSFTLLFLLILSSYSLLLITFSSSEAFLEDEQTVEAEIFLNKASSLMNTIDEWTLQLRYRTTFARILDSNRKFLEAASRYYELSSTNNMNVSLLLLLSALS